MVKPPAARVISPESPGRVDMQSETHRHESPRSGHVSAETRMILDRLDSVDQRLDQQSMLLRAIARVVCPEGEWQDDAGRK